MSATKDNHEVPTEWDDITIGVGSTQEIARPSNRARLIALAGSHAGRVHELEGETPIGRHIDATVRIDSSDVSRHHARIFQDASGAWVIQDLGSRNGTLVNRAPIVDESRVLSYGDRIQFGSSCLFIFSHFDDLEQQILQSQRMEAVGRLAGGIVHDFNNVMTAILGTADYLEVLARDEHPISPEQLIEGLREIKQASMRATTLTRGLLGFSGSRDPATPRAMSVSELTREVTQLCRHAFPNTIRVDLSIEEDLVVSGHETQLHQILMNLCMNARDAMPEGGDLSLRVQGVDLEGPSAPAIPFLTPGVYALVSVSDTGHGMNPEVARRAFEPFFTTKSSQEGTGLGLATVYGLVRNHGGYVQLDSVEGQGTEVRVYLPTMLTGEADGRSTASTPHAISVQRSGLMRASTNGTVLVVDDEPAVLRSTQRLLRSLGWTSLAASDGREAIALMATRGHEVDLVLLDTVMPRLSGAETYEILHSLAPETPIVMMSGYDPKGGSNTALTDGAAAFLAKPFDAQTLRQTLRKVVDGRPTQTHRATQNRG
jgi:two-component system cell cycle sensor histidine kinase/response regulator CckA